MANTPTVYVLCDKNCRFEGMTKEQILSAIMQAVNEGTIGNIDAGFITTIKTVNNIHLKFFVGEQSAYDELTEEEKQGLFAIITNDTTKEGIEEAIKELQESKALFEKVMAGDLPVPKATSAEKDSSGRKIDETYAALANGYIPINNTVVIRKGTLLVYWEGSTETKKHIGDIIAGGTIKIGNIGEADYAKSVGLGAINTITNQAIVLGEISSDTNGRKYLIQIL